MSYKVYTERVDTQEPRLYLSQHGDVYSLPTSRADLVRHLRFQRRLTAHLANVIIVIGRGQEVQL
jgi:hypothetical protein